MKALITILIFPAIALALNAQSSGGSPGSHAANGGFSQPPATAPSTPANTPSAANPNASRNPNNNFNPNINGTTPGMTNGAAPPVTNRVDAFGDTNNSAAAGFNTNSGMAPGAKPGINDNAINPQSPLNRNPNMNTDGDVTNANGTMTFNTNAPHWWEKKP